MTLLGCSPSVFLSISYALTFLVECGNVSGYQVTGKSFLESGVELTSDNVEHSGFKNGRTDES